MAKKKTATTTKAKLANGKSKARKSAPSVKPATKKVARKSPAQKAKSAKKPAAKKSGSKTVDGILKAFEKEHVAKNRALTSTRKKIESLTKQIASIKGELESLKKTAVETEIAIDTLDSRRDAEVGALLSGMGVDLARAAASTKPKEPVEKATPLFDSPGVAQSNGNHSTSDAD